MFLALALGHIGISWHLVHSHASSFMYTSGGTLATETYRGGPPDFGRPGFSLSMFGRCQAPLSSAAFLHLNFECASNAHTLYGSSNSSASCKYLVMKKQMMANSLLRGMMTGAGRLHGREKDTRYERERSKQLVTAMR